MIELQGSNIQLQAHARDKDDAIRQVGLLLVESGFIEPGYVRSMLGREQQANTYLGNGMSRYPRVSTGIRASACTSWWASPPAPTST